MKEPIDPVQGREPCTTKKDSGWRVFSLKSVLNGMTLLYSVLRGAAKLWNILKDIFVD